MSMDSATSESFQSSNAGGAVPGDFEDFDSRPPPDSISSFLNLPPPQPPPIPQTSRLIFDPFPSYPSNSFLADLDATNWPPPPPPPLHHPSSTPNPASSSAAAPRTSKKRSRASRRAPTTVLTTDTSNFRAMVQEFTGIPAPPFATSSLFSRPRLDLFNHSSSSSSTPSFLLRPFAQKRQATGVSGSIAGISSNTLASTSTIQNQNFFLSSPTSSLNLQSLLQEQQRAMALCQWPPGGYAGGELGSVIAGTSADADSMRIGSCKADHTGSSRSEKQAVVEGFSAAPAPPHAAARGESGMDAWQISSD
ncbi:protein piccolo-like [Phalaenopsis equestris]|uniref:protein piccolo-like n=1 Tax=Phalaenopsis equestris TaxID=78828 RepID=UPI0009E1B92D|nr:protein piccolo-like [Phalaenopsis equestris]